MSANAIRYKQQQHKQQRGDTPAKHKAKTSQRIGLGTSSSSVAGLGKPARVTFEVHVDSVLAAPRLALADDDGGHDLLPEVRLTLLDGGHDHVADAGRRQAVEPALDALDGDDVEVLGARVVSAVHGRRHGQTQRHAELVPRRPSPPCGSSYPFRHRSWLS